MADAGRTGATGLGTGKTTAGQVTEVTGKNRTVLRGAKKKERARAKERTKESTSPRVMTRKKVDLPENLPK